jgi:hypothetical protein
MTFYRKLAALWQQLPNKSTMAGAWLGILLGDVHRHWGEYHFATSTQTHATLYSILGAVISTSIGVAVVSTCIVMIQAFRHHKQASARGAE